MKAEERLQAHEYTFRTAIAAATEALAMVRHDHQGASGRLQTAIFWKNCAARNLRAMEELITPTLKPLGKLRVTSKGHR